MLLTTLLPVGAYAADDSAIEDTTTNYEEPVASELEDVSIELEDQESEQADDTSAVTEISDYETFLSCFKVLEGYAQTLSLIHIWMVLEGVELVQLDIDDLFLAPAWCILRFFVFLRSGSGLYRWSRFFLRFLFCLLYTSRCV